MKLVTYPLDGVTYSAEDVAAYLCTRTSGVYSRDSNFAVTVSGCLLYTSDAADEL